MVGNGTNCQPRIKAIWRSGIRFSIFAASNHRSDDEKDAGVVQRLLSDFAGYGSVKETRVLETGQIGLHK